MIFGIWRFFKNLPRQFKFYLKIWQEKLILYIESSLHLWWFLSQFFLEWKICQTKVVENFKTHILCSTIILRKMYRLWDNVEKYGRTGRAKMKIWRMHIACWIPKDTNTHPEYVILTALLLQQYLHESSSILQYKYFVCLVIRSSPPRWKRRHYGLLWFARFSS
jgi:hypothetical protein